MGVDMKKNNKNIKAFSLAEMMVVLLVISIVLSAMMPIISKRARLRPTINTTAILPTQTEGQACTATATNNTAISSDYTTLLTCQSSRWKRAVATIPIVTSGGSCTGDPTNNKYIGISADYKTLYTCQSNVWKIAMTTIPIVASGDSCNTPTSTNYNIGISADNKTIYTCQSNAMTALPSGGGSGEVLYIYHRRDDLLPSCPAGWTSAGVGEYDLVGDNSLSYTFTKACYHKTKTCSTMYLYNKRDDMLPSCPTDWTSAGKGEHSISGTYTYPKYTYVNSCYKCD